MKSEIITVGTEILMGQISNTNASFLSDELLKLGVGVYYQSVVGDNPARLEEVFKTALQRADLVVMTGGLGPTQDDLTRETVARVLQLHLEKDNRWEERLEEFFRQRGRTMPDNNRKQALVPRGGKILPNKRGTAPGIFLENKEKVVILLPGPPREMKELYREQVSPLLKEKLQNRGIEGVLISKTLKVIGLGESAMEEKISSLLREQDNPTIAPLAKRSEVHLRITARAANKEEAADMIEQKKREIEKVLGDYIYGEDDQELEDVVADLLMEKSITLAVAESCSGGLLCHRLTNIPGSSGYLVSGLVTYSNQAKIDFLGVQEDMLEKKGAVSEEVAAAMASGVRKRTGAEIGLGITGIAGPSGGTPEKPVGLTYISLNTAYLEYCRGYQLWGTRQEIKERASQAALNLLRYYLLGKLG